MNTSTQQKGSAQIAAGIVMVKPAHFGYNPQTASTNTFQEDRDQYTKTEISEKARREFDAFVELLRASDVDVHVFEEREKGETPDAVFPNNWMSTHPDGTVVLYPMMAPNRRLERRRDIVDHLEAHYRVSRVLDISDYEKTGVFLEGTGSIVFDHDAGIAYANASPRTDGELLRRLCRELDYQPVLFHAFDRSGQDIYHTNVLLNIGKGFAVVCTECIWDQERQGVCDMLSASALEVIDIGMDQLESFAGNVIQVGNGKNSSRLVMSTAAYEVLREDQIQTLERHAPILHSDLSAIETIGGGSARCMIAGIHLATRNA